MPNPIICLLILLVLFLILLFLCIFTQFYLLIKGGVSEPPPQEKPQVFKIKKYKRQKKSNKNQDDTITIEGRLISSDEFKKEGGS